MANLMDKKSGEYKITDRVPWFVKAKEEGGITYMHSFAVGVITSIINDRYYTADEIVQEMRGTLSDLEKVWNDGSIFDGYRHEKALRANGEPRKKKSLRVYHGLRKSSRSILKK